MTSETRERLGLLVERRLAGLLGETETAELATLLEASAEARELYLRAVEFHLDLGAAPVREAVPAPVRQPSGVTGKPLRGWAARFAVVPVAAGFLLVAVLFMLWDLPWMRKPDDIRVETDISRAPKSAPSRNPSLSPAPDPPPIYNPDRSLEIRHNIMANVWMANMASVISECMRYRHLDTEWAQLQADVAAYEVRIKRHAAELHKGEPIVFQPYLQQGDQIVGFAQRDFTTMKPSEAAAVLHAWVNNWSPGPGMEEVLIVRGERKLTLHLQFPEDTPELQKLVHHPFLQLEVAPRSSLVAEIVAIPAELIQNLNTSFNALPPGYRSILPPADRKRLEDLTASKRGSPEDIEWLKTRIIGEVIPSFQSEAGLIRSQVLVLEQKLKDNALTDVIYLKKGNRIEGQIITQTATEVKVKTRFGAASVPMGEILAIQKGMSLATEFPQRYAEARGNLEKLAPLFAWCTEKNYKLEREYVAYVVLTLDASHEKARAAVGLVRPSMGAVIQPPPKDSADSGIARIQGVDNAVGNLAMRVTSGNAAFSNVIVEMRRQTEGMTTDRMPIMSAKLNRGVLMIQDPLTFDPAKLTEPNAVEMGTWWGSLSRADRWDFACYYGLWCVFQRGRK